MSDEADMTSAREEIENEIRRKYLDKNLGLEVEHTGVCLNCGDKTIGTQRWCDVMCRNDWQRRVNNERAR